MPNPEQGPEQQGEIGTWQTVSLGLPDFLEPIRQAVDAFFSALIQILNILLAILDILKTFAIGFLDPIIALIEALLALIEKFLQDLRQAGLYIHGDFYILEGPEFRDLLGGFSAYERRMITRLVDRSDPNRPNISSFSACVAVFFYVSADLTAFERIMRFLRGILALFNRRVPLPRSLGAVVNVQATYGLDGAGVSSFKKPGFFPSREQFRNEKLSSAFNAVNLTWQMAPTPGNFVTPFAQLPPAGFLVEVSTISQGISVQYDKPIKGSNEGSPDNKGRDAGTCVDDNSVPITLFGGVDQLRVDPSIEFNVGSTLGLIPELKPLAVRVFGVKNLADAAPIDFSDLKSGGDYFIQRTFYTSSAQSGFFPGKGYGLTLVFEDMPRDAEFEPNGGRTTVKQLERPSKFFVRVRPVSKSIQGPEDFAYQADRVTFDDAPNPVQLGLFQPNGGGEDQVTLSDIGPLSAPLEVVFPGPDTEDYLRCVVNALIVMALGRADLPVRAGTVNGQTVAVNFPPQDGDPGIPTGFAPNKFWGAYVGTAREYTRLEDVAALLIPQLFGRKRRIGKFYESTDNLGKWRKRLLARCVALCNRMYEGNRPPATIEGVVVDGCQDLLGFTFPGEGFTLQEALNNGETSFGVAPNPMSLGLKSTRKQFASQFDGTLLVREPAFFASAEGTKTKGSADGSPVYYTLENQAVIEDVAFCRNLFSPAVYEQAAFALRIAIGPFQRPQEKGWIAIRLFPQGLPAIDRFLDELVALLRSIRAALQAITDLIKRFIEFLQSRIIELQALLNRINAMIQNLLRLFIGLPTAAGLVVIANGTDGVLQSLVSAGNKPFDSPNSYGGGAVLMAGGIPTIALDLFKALIQGGD